jgi:oligopeptide transport system ATP-binding protein
MSSLLEIRNLTTRFHTHEGVVHAVNGVSYCVAQGETLGIVGESGCGKSVAMLSVMRLIPEPPGKIEAGEVLFDGRDLLRLGEAEMERVRGAEIAMIFQDPMTSLNPTLTVGFQIAEALRLHQGMSKRQARERGAELLAVVGIPRACERLNDYPHQFSGGMRQRAMIAMALSCNPKLLIADEPTTALDVTVQAQIIDLVKRLQEKLGMTVIWITHDLGVLARLAQRVMVMYAGYVVEDAPVDELYTAPRHPYTQGLLGSLPCREAGYGNPAYAHPRGSAGGGEPDGTRPRSGRSGARLASIPGQPPSLLAPDPGCPFAPRCSCATEQCTENPRLVSIAPRHLVACWRYEHTEGARTSV